MASTTTSTPLFLSSSSALVDGKAPCQSATIAASQCVSLPTLPPPRVQCQSQSRLWKSTAYCRNISRNVVAMATGEAQVEVATTDLPEFEIPEFVTTVQQAWEKVEDKYAVTSLAVAAVVAVWASSGVVSALDRLPLVPGVLELVGIGYTGYFVYRNLVFKPDREALIRKIKETYNEIIGTS